MDEKRKRGRPKHWLNDPPDHIKALAGIPYPVIDQMLKSAEQLERMLREGEPLGVSTRLLAELNDFDILTPERKRTVLLDYQKHIVKIKKGQKDGAESTQKNAHDRGLKICDKNKALIEKVIPNGNHTIHGVANLIRNEWEKRGTGGMAPSINTLSTYIKRYLQRQA
jgi:hypothetical protein